MKRTTIAVAGLLLLPMLSEAQDSAVVGSWSGNFSVPTNVGLRSIAVELTIESADGGAIKGVAMNHSQPCYGKYPFVGKLTGNDLAVRATAKGGPSGDCDFGLRGKIEGNKITGKVGPYDVELSKR